MTGPTDILLVRHPETQANVDGRFVGRSDTPYTDLGRRQFARLPLKIARFAPDLVWSSPLTRASSLAKKTATLSAVPLRIDPRVVEIDFGVAEGLSMAQIEASGAFLNYYELEEPIAQGGESRGSVERRVSAFCDELCSLGGRHVVVTHGGAFRAALVHLLALPAAHIWAFHVANAQLAHVRVVEGHGTLESFVRG